MLGLEYVVMRGIQDIRSKATPTNDTIVLLNIRYMKSPAQNNIANTVTIWVSCRLAFLSFIHTIVTVPLETAIPVATHWSKTHVTFHHPTQMNACNKYLETDPFLTRTSSE